MSAEISGHWQVHIRSVAELRCVQLHYWNAAVSKSMWAVAVIPVVRGILGWTQTELQQMKEFVRRSSVAHNL